MVESEEFPRQYVHLCARRQVDLDSVGQLVPPQVYTTLSGLTIRESKEIILIENHSAKTLHEREECGNHLMAASLGQKSRRK